MTTARATHHLVLQRKPSHLSYFSVGQMRGSSHLAQKHVDIGLMSEHSEAEKLVISIIIGNIHY